MADYSIDLGISVDTSELDKVKSQINSLENKEIKIRLDTSGVQSQINSIKSQLADLGNVKIGLGAKTGGSSALSGFAREFNNDVVSIKTTANNAANTIQHMRDTLAKAKFSNSSIDVITKDLEKMSLEVQRVTTRINGNNLNLSVRGIDEFGRVVTIVKEFDYHSGEITNVGKTIAQSFDTSADGAKRFQKEVNAAFQDIKSSKKEIGNLEIELINEKDIRKIDSITGRIRELQSKVDDSVGVYGEHFSRRQSDVLKSIDEGISYKKKDTQIEFDIKADTDAVTADFEKLKSLAEKITNTRIDIFKSSDTADISKASAELNKLTNEYDELFAKTKGSLTNKQLSQLDNLVDQGDAKALNEFNKEMNEFVKLQSQMANKRFEIGRLEILGGKENEIAELKRQLEELENTYSRLMHTFMKKVSANSDFVKIGDFSNLENGIENVTREAENRIERFKSQLTDMRAEAAKGIKLDIELGNYDNQISQMDDKFNKLSHASDELRNSVEATRDAYKALENAMNTSTGDEVADAERLIRAQEDYARALEKTNNLIRIQAREEKKAADIQRLDDNKAVFGTQIDAWLKQNSAAVKQFGTAMAELKSQIQSADSIQLNHLKSQFKQLDAAAEQFGVKGLSGFDKMKAKFKEYVSYISAAELFSYAERALESMFEQVKLVDAAMTELKKVTNESDASYAAFLDNAGSRAKALGTTIDGLVTSTADFARLGYDFKEAQGLAEVANIYAVVGDDIENVEQATESLISTMSAFKKEMGSMSDSQFAMSIIDVFNELGNKFAISSGGIGEAFERSASSMAAANNTFHETAALITAANTVVQNPEQVGKWLCRL